jgi:hypothetical protein
MAVNCLLSNESDFTGGMPFWVVGERWVEAVSMAQGDCLYHSGGLKHGALPVGSGKRFVAIFFFDLYDLAAVEDG